MRAAALVSESAQCTTTSCADHSPGWGRHWIASGGTRARAALRRGAPGGGGAVRTLGEGPRARRGGGRQGGGGGGGSLAPTRWRPPRGGAPGPLGVPHKGGDGPRCFPPAVKTPGTLVIQFASRHTV